MSLKQITVVRQSLADIKSKITPLADRLDAGEKLTEAETAQLAVWETEGDHLNARLDELIERETARLKAEERDKAFSQLLPEGVPDGTDKLDAKPATPVSRATLGTKFVESDVFKAAKKRGGNSDAMSFELALIKSVDANGKPLAGVARARDQVQPEHETPLLDAFGFEPISTNSFEYVAWPLTVPRAGVVAEGAPKPEATDAPFLVPGVLEKLAHWIPITQEYLEDTARLAAITSGRLVDGVLDKAEEQAAAALVAATLPTQEGDSLLAAIRIGVADVQMRGFRPRDVALSPMDYASIDIDLLTRTLNGAQANSPLWALNVIPVGAIAAGTAYVGDFKAAGTVFARSQVVVRMTDSHADYFISNKLVILAEQRVTTAIVQPAAITEVTAAPETP